uniref:isocitrate dehydrogenase kinase/phosphatase AceK regulatory subunit n=1 Tax=Salmonella enterica TaxID=28901 RepID=UPI003296AE22
EPLVMRKLSDIPLLLPWKNKSRDNSYNIAHLTETLGEDALHRCHVQVANELFYRNKSAWLVGKLTTPDGTLPCLMPIHRTDEGQL